MTVCVPSASGRPTSCAPKVERTPGVSVPKPTASRSKSLPKRNVKPPICVAAANANLDVLEHDGIVEQVAGLGDALRDTLAAAVADSPIVGEVRGTGMLAAIEFVADPGKKVRFDAGHKVGARISAACLDNGLIARAMPHGDILGFAPPLIATRDDMHEIAAIVGKSVSRVCDELSSAGVI